MTKLLYVPSGDFVYFVSSIAYDEKMGNKPGKVIEIEDSFTFEDNQIDTFELLIPLIRNGYDGFYRIGNEYYKFYKHFKNLNSSTFEFIP